MYTHLVHIFNIEVFGHLEDRAHAVTAQEQSLQAVSAAEQRESHARDRGGSERSSTEDAKLWHP